MSNTQTITLSVPEVNCEHCVKTINSTLGGLPGIETVSTDIPTRSVHLKYDGDQISLETIAAQLGDAGYTIAK